MWVGIEGGSGGGITRLPRRVTSAPNSPQRHFWQGSPGAVKFTSKDKVPLKAF